MGPVAKVILKKYCTADSSSSLTAMKARSGVAKSLFTRAQGTKVLGRLGNDIGAKFHDDASGRLSANGHVKVDLWFGPAE